MLCRSSVGVPQSELILNNIHKKVAFYFTYRGYENVVIVLTINVQNVKILHISLSNFVNLKSEKSNKINGRYLLWM